MPARSKSANLKGSTATIGFDADIGTEGADTFRNVQHPDLRADSIPANPPVNDADTALRGSAFLQSEATMQVVSKAKDNFRKDEDVRWRRSGATSTSQGSRQRERGGVLHFGVPPKGNADFAWVQHFINHLAPQGMAGVDFVCLRNAPTVLANGNMYSNQSGEADIRRAIVEADFVDCIITVPGQHFYSTTIDVCLWLHAKNKAADAKRGFLAGRKQSLFINAHKLGTETSPMRASTRFSLN